MMHIMALALLFVSSPILAGTSLCHARLVNTFSRTHVGSLTLQGMGSKVFAHLKQTNGNTLTTSNVGKERLLTKDSHNFGHFMTLMKDNSLSVAGIKNFRVRRIDFGHTDLNFVVTKSVKFIASHDGFLFGVCK